MKRLILSAAFRRARRGRDGSGAARGTTRTRWRRAAASLPAGWSARLDNGSTKPDGVSVAKMGTGIHIKSGPAGIYFRAADTANGAYDVSAMFTQMEPAAHPEAYGVFIGGSDLAAARIRSTRTSSSARTGNIIIKRRAGAATPTVTNWTDSAAIKKADASGKMTNTLAIQIGKDKAHFLVNGTEVAAVPIADVDASGIAGLRVNHNLNLHVEGFTTRGAKTAAQK